MESLLIPPCSSGDESPFFIYRHSDGKKFACADYEQLGHALARSVVESDRNHGLCIDWTQCQTHPLIFVVDAENPRGVDTHDILLDYFHRVLLRVLQRHLLLPTFTVLLSMRRRHRGGMHVHVLNVELSHDDYLHLCFLMRDGCFYGPPSCVCRFRLTFPSTMFLVGCDSPHETGGLYLPVRLIRLEFPQYSSVGDARPTADELAFPDEPPDAGTPFDRVSRRVRRDRLADAARLAMPLPRRDDSVVRLQFATRIVPADSRTSDFSASFTSRLNQREYFVVKDGLLSEGPPEDSFAHRFLKDHARFLDSFRAYGAEVLFVWYARYSAIPGNHGGLFASVDRDLARSCPHLKGVSRPLKVLLQSRESQSPTFYALCNLLKKERDVEPEELAERLSSLACQRLRVTLPPPEEASRLTFDTLAYCAFKTTPTETKKDEFFTHIGAGWDWIFRSTDTVSEMIRHVRAVQKRFFPMVKGVLGDRVSGYFWDPAIDRWSVLTKKRHVEVVLWYIGCCMTHFEGYDEVPKEIRTALRDQPEWTGSLVDDVWNELAAAEPVPFRPSRASRDRHHGLNVPEYYFAEEAKRKTDELASLLTSVGNMSLKDD